MPYERCNKGSVVGIRYTYKGKSYLCYCLYAGMEKTCEVTYLILKSSLEASVLSFIRLVSGMLSGEGWRSPTTQKT